MKSTFLLLFLFSSFVAFAGVNPGPLGSGGSGGVSVSALSVINYGATGDGSTNDRVAVQAALDAGASQHRPVYFPAGTYKIQGGALSEAWKGMTVFGDGQWTSVIKQYDDYSGFIVGSDQDDLYFHDLQIAFAGSGSTHSGLLFDGHAGNNIDALCLQNVTVMGFNVGMEIYGVANSQFLNCCFQDATTKNVYSHGNNNSLSFVTSCTVSSVNSSCGYELDGGNGITIQGGDLVQTATSGAQAVKVNGANGVTIRGLNIESYNSNTGAPIQQLATAGDLTLDNVIASNYVTGTYLVEIAAGGTLWLRGQIGGPSGTHGGTVRMDDYSGRVFADVYGTPVDWYNPTFVGQTRAGPFTSILANDGLTAGSTSSGLIRWQSNQGGGDDVLETFAQRSGSSQYGIVNLLQYDSDVRNGVLGKLNTANSWSGTQTINNLITPSSFGNPNAGPSTIGAGHYWYGNGLYYNWGEFNALYGSGDDWGLFVGTSAGTITPGSGNTTNPSKLMIYCDGQNNRTTIGHFAGTQPTGTAALTVEGTLTATGVFHLSSQARPGSATEGDIYIDSSDHHTYEWNGSAWKQLDN